MEPTRRNWSPIRSPEELDRSRPRDRDLRIQMEERRGRGRGVRGGRGRGMQREPSVRGNRYRESQEREGEEVRRRYERRDRM